MRQMGQLGIAQGEVMPFSDFESGGAMWTGEGPREIRHELRFETAFAEAPAVHLGVTMWDISNAAPMRLDVSAEAITREGFVIRVGTWSDSRIARLRVGWMAIGPCHDDEVWEID